MGRASASQNRESWRDLNPEEIQFLNSEWEDAFTERWWIYLGTLPNRLLKSTNLDWAGIRDDICQVVQRCDVHFIDHSSDF